MDQYGPKPHYQLVSNKYLIKSNHNLTQHRANLPPFLLLLPIPHYFSCPRHPLTLVYCTLLCCTMYSINLFTVYVIVQLQSVKFTLYNLNLYIVQSKSLHRTSQFYTNTVHLLYKSVQRKYEVCIYVNQFIKQCIQNSNQ